MSLKLIPPGNIRLKNPELAGRLWMNADYLLNDINPDSLLAPARIRAGIAGQGRTLIPTGNRTIPASLAPCSDTIFPPFPPCMKSPATHALFNG